MFLIGPVRQLQSMKESHRLCASLLYLTSLVMTLVSVYVFKIGIIIVFFIVLQWIGLIWYSLSYIPYGRSIATRYSSTSIHLMIESPFPLFQNAGICNCVTFRLRVLLSEGVRQ